MRTRGVLIESVRLKGGMKEKVIFQVSLGFPEFLMEELRSFVVAIKRA